MYLSRTALGLNQLVGKTITGIVITERASRPRGQVFIACSDNTYYEFFSIDSSIEGLSYVAEGGIEEIMALTDKAEIVCAVSDTPGSARPINQPSFSKLTLHGASSSAVSTNRN